MKLRKIHFNLLVIPLVLFSATSTHAQEDWWGPYAPASIDPELPNVLIIGDSISGGAQGYLYEVRNNLARRANVFQSNITRRTSYALDEWPNVLNDHTDWDVIHFNWGLHDLEYEAGSYHVPIADYTDNLDGVGNIIDRFEGIVNANGESPVLLWASTTPVPSGVSVTQGTEGRSNDDVIAYNTAAATIMNSRGISITDLYAGVDTHSNPELLFRSYPDNVHFTNSGANFGNTFLGGLVTTAIDPYVPEAPMLMEGVVGLWTFNEKSVGQVGSDGDPVLDTSGNTYVHNGTIIADISDDIPYVAGNPAAMDGAALRFERGLGGGSTEGINDSVEVPGDVDFQFNANQSFTYETMIRTTQVTGGPAGSDTQGAAPLVQAATGNFWIDDDQPGKVMFSPGFGTKNDAEFSGADTRAKTWSTTAVNDDEWHHIAGVFDAATEMVRLYIDGVEEGATDVSAWINGASWSGTVGAGADEYLTFGSTGQGTAIREFEGDMDFVRISRGALLPTEFYGLSQPVLGDFDGNEIVDGNDFLVWQRDPLTGNLGDWQDHYGESSSITVSSGAVPEPSCFILTGMALLSLGFSRKR
ncbi:LamG-like jellyroll fold domain-containing protein [Adhaeretor mobilis]|uniref:LamG-like jellyroll fold domain-containing protein n=1 Tax=Adhaeretor mobilis TaxID=1930276 RepID=A0A517MW79_9BACT|nr:LamG-like jellyroll fold domain-containing protein [Adhaeretor mobilis]QDS99133.1 hypothetical protein HG15A2_24250 [Adhaeretor mobilis]